MRQGEHLFCSENIRAFLEGTLSCSVPYSGLTERRGENLLKMFHVQADAGSLDGMGRNQ